MKPSEFGNRRKNLLKRLKNAAMIVPSAPPLVNVGHGFDYYRQASHFYYLTGIDESDSCLILAPDHKKQEQLFITEKDPEVEKWEGTMLGTKGAKTEKGIAHVYPNQPYQLFDEVLLETLLMANVLYYRVGVNASLDQRIFALLPMVRRRRRMTSLLPIVDPETLLSEMRLIKSKAEIERIRRAADISAEAHVGAIRAAKPGVYEYQLEALLAHTFRALGARGPAYNFIVASGENACTLHYNKNSRKLGKNELVLIDAGAEFDYYASDITRTFPSDGRFTKEQREIYNAVLTAQKEAIAIVKPGQTIRAVHERAVEVLTEELIKLKILKGNLKTLLRQRAYYPFYFHGTSHWLGLDTHDPGESTRPLEPGMVLTVEPGLYFLPKAPGPRKYRGIGVRIEDDVLVTEDGCEILTSKVPKEIEEIESLGAS